MMSKEQLEEIKDRYMELEYDFNLRKEDIEWLIEQAERVQELEEENKRYREALEEIANKKMTYADMFGAIRTAKEALEGED